MRLKEIILFAFFVFGNLTMWAGENDPTPQKQAVESYIEYLNQCSRLVHFPHYQAGDFNRNINHFVDEWTAQTAPQLQKKYGKPLKIWYSMNNPNAEDEHHLGDKEPLIRVEELFRKSLASTKDLPLAYRSGLSDQLKKMEALMSKYISLVRQFETLTETPKYLTRSAIPDIYDMLDDYELIVFDFSSLKYKMYQDLSSSYGDEEITLEMRELYLMADNIYEMVMAMRREDPTDTKFYYDEVHSVYFESDLGKRLQARATEKGFEDWSGSLYYAILDITGFIMEDVDKYLGNEKEWDERPWYDEYGSAYYYGEPIMHYYNCPQGGIATFYNGLTEFEEGDQLKVTEEPMWFKVLKREFDDEIDGMVAQSAKTLDLGKNEIDATHALKGYASNNLVFLVDVSASMKSDDKLPLLQESLKELVRMMRPEDHIALVRYAGEAEVVLPSTSSSDTEKIYAAIDALRIGGQTDGLEGMKMAYDHAEETYIKDGNNRIILATDGKFDVDGRINRMIRMNARENIKLSAFLFGLRSNSAVRDNLKALVEFGQGNYAHLKLGEDVHEPLLKESKALRK